MKSTRVNPHLWGFLRCRVVAYELVVGLLQLFADVFIRGFHGGLEKVVLHDLVDVTQFVEQFGE